VSTPSSFICPRCKMISYQPEDVEEGYCGECHDWTGADFPQVSWQGRTPTGEPIKVVDTGEPPDG
jgi:hypothetical protein